MYLVLSCLATLLVVLTQPIVAWAPLYQIFKSNQHVYLSRSKNSRLGVQPHLPVTDEKMKSKPLIHLSWDATKENPKKVSLTSTPIEILKNEQDSSLSPELLGAGAMAGSIAIVVSLLTARSFDWR